MHMDYRDEYVYAFADWTFQDELQAAQMARVIKCRGHRYFVESDHPSFESDSIGQIMDYIDNNEIGQGWLTVYDPATNQTHGTMLFRRYRRDERLTPAERVINECLAELYDCPVFGNFTDL